MLTPRIANVRTYVLNVKHVFTSCLVTLLRSIVFIQSNVITLPALVMLARFSHINFTRCHENFTRCHVIYGIFHLFGLPEVNITPFTLHNLTGLGTVPSPVWCNVNASGPLKCHVGLAHREEVGSVRIDGARPGMICSVNSSPCSAHLYSREFARDRRNSHCDVHVAVENR